VIPVDKRPGDRIQVIGLFVEEDSRIAVIKLEQAVKSFKGTESDEDYIDSDDLMPFGYGFDDQQTKQEIGKKFKPSLKGIRRDE
jgi:hypothetical protein